MNKDLKIMLDNYIQECLDFLKVEKGQGFCVGIGVDEKAITQAQDVLQVKFSEQYKNFLKTYGETDIEGFQIYGLSFAKQCSKGLIEVNRYYKSQRWPGIDDWYIVSDDGFGNPIGVKPDGSVWLSCHDESFAQLLLADDFEEFLYRLLTDKIFQKGTKSIPLEEINKR